jgi:glyoxylase-like metal-dependent hydrolase (beta-lactamase superfamily II)
MTGVHTLAIPTPFRVGRVNCYLIEDEPLTLVDVGPNSAQSLVALEQALAQHGRRLEDLERIVITHQHADHLGLVGIVADRSGAEVCALGALVPVVENFKRYSDANDKFAQALMLRHGIADDVVTVLGAVSLANRGWGGSAKVTRVLDHDGTLEFANRTLQVLHRPGHISSNPLISLPPDGRVPQARPKTLLTYIESLEHTRAMPVETVLPGHGIEFTGHAQLIDERFEMHERRARRFYELLADQPRSAHDLAQAMWGNVAVTQAYLTLSEVLGHLDLLMERGEVAEVERDGVVQFTTT